MKVQVEMSFQLKADPELFKTLEIKSRDVYVWQKYRGYLSNDEPWKTFIRCSVQEKMQDPTTFMEVWEDGDISDPPPNVDDIWNEQYKIIEYDNYTMEWHSKINTLRITWYQSKDTLIQQKLTKQIVTLLESMNLECPNFPTLK
jgi:hypothetical protein